MAAALCLAFLALVAATSPVRDLGAVALDFAVPAVVAVAFGSAVGAVVHRELDGALVLFLVAAVQAVANPYGLIAKVIPFWSSRELGTYAVDGPDAASVAPALLHGALVVALCAAVLAVTHRASRRAGGQV